LHTSTFEFHNVLANIKLSTRHSQT